jgi:acyl-CoA synthetase (AMP-forming)/AMP-acid ligase II
MNLAQFLVDTTNRIPDHPAVRYRGEVLTYGQMNGRVDSLAHGLTRLGIGPKDKYPRIIRLVEELPKTSTGRIFKRGIRLDG